MRLVNAEDFDMSGPAWLVDGILPEESHVLLYGQTGHGKSFVAIDLANSIAAGIPFMGQETQQGDVLYIAAEAPREIVRRMAAWRKDRGVGRIPVYVYGEDVQLPKEEQVAELLDSIREQNISPRLIIFDTFGRCALGVEENVADQINTQVNAPISRIVRETGATVVLIHHTGNATNRPRGSTALSDPCDTVIKVSRTDGGVRITCDKQRSSEPFSPILANTRHSGGTMVLDYTTTVTPPAPKEGKPRVGKQRVTNATRIEEVAQQQPGIPHRQIMGQLGISKSSFYYALKNANVLDNEGKIYPSPTSPVQ